MNLTDLLSPEKANIFEDNGKFYICSVEMPEAKPEELVVFINRYFAQSDFVKDTVRMRKHQKEYFAHKREDDLKKAKTLEYKIDQYIKQLAKLHEQPANH